MRSLKALPLLVALVVFLILFGCGTCSTIATNPEMTNVAVASQLEADYGPWAWLRS